MTPLVMWNLVTYAKFTKVRVHNNKEPTFHFPCHTLYFIYYCFLFVFLDFY